MNLDEDEDEYEDEYEDESWWWWWWLSSHESYLVMKVILRWMLSSDASHNSQRSDDLWRFACGDVSQIGQNMPPGPVGKVGKKITGVQNKRGDN